MKFEEVKKETVQIPLGRLHRFPGHPYKVEDNEEMEALAESIREQGILTSLLVRRVEGSETDYELISGHRRAYAAAKGALQNERIAARPLSMQFGVVKAAKSARTVENFTVQAHFNWRWFLFATPCVEIILFLSFMRSPKRTNVWVYPIFCVKSITWCKAGQNMNDSGGGIAHPLSTV